MEPKIVIIGGSLALAAASLLLIVFAGARLKQRINHRLSLALVTLGLLGLVAASTVLAITFPSS